MKLGAKMLLSPLLVAAVSVCAAAVYGVVDYNEGEKNTVADTADITRLKVTGQSTETLSLMRGSVYRTLALMSSLDEKAVKAAREELRATGTALQTTLGALDDKSSADAEFTKRVADATTHLTEFVKRCDKSIDLSSLDPNVGTGAMRAAEDVYGQLSADLKALQTHADEVRVARIEATRQRQARLSAALALALLAGASAAAFVSWRIQRRMVQGLRRAVALSESVAQGDLVSVASGAHDAGNDEIGDLTRALSKMVQGLEASLQTVRQATDCIGTAASEIATGNTDLSQRTEEAASSLQQTASSMEQLTGTVGQTADSARTANQLAASASTVAKRGGAVVSEVVSTMEQINTASRRIADIIGTIDGIAFQTNILALNAAVEAARAGEQGRGFAVVASEVRSLAQRSAEAAREIKTLIGASVERVQAGTRLVADAGTTMDEIVASVQRVTDIIGEISAATGEQSGGIAQVNGAVNDLDRMTQQNAALVEESAAAAESLREQATRLAEVVSGFQLGTPPTAPAVAARAVVARAQSSARRPVAAHAAPAAKPAAATAAPASAAGTTAAAAPTDAEWESF